MGVSAVSTETSAVIVHMPAHPAWTGPNPISVSNGTLVTMYSQGASAVHLSTSDDPPQSTYEGENANPDDATY